MPLQNHMAVLKRMAMDADANGQALTEAMTNLMREQGARRSASCEEPAAGLIDNAEPYFRRCSSVGSSTPATTARSKASAPTPAIKRTSSAGQRPNIKHTSSAGDVPRTRPGMPPPKATRPGISPTGTLTRTLSH
ncbi:hypothetical protein T484DRAFT_1961158 [Baffinella frigidus]|nr:hypothetical protein T484DRAFT_1961158 [Cryptophyta sp. CCMP2293]